MSEVSELSIMEPEGKQGARSSIGTKASKEVDESTRSGGSSPPSTSSSPLDTLESIASRLESNLSRLGKAKVERLAVRKSFTDDIRSLGKVVTECSGDLRQRAENLALDIVRGLSKKIIFNAAREDSSGSAGCHGIVLVEVLQFVLARQVGDTAAQAELYLFDTKGCVSVLLGRQIFQKHFRDLELCSKVFELCAGPYHEHLLKRYSQIIALGWPTALKAAVFHDKFSDVELSCFLRAMVLSQRAIPLAQSVFDAPCLAVLLDQGAAQAHGGFREDILNMLSPDVSDMPHVSDVPPSRAKLVREIEDLSRSGQNGTRQSDLVVRRLMHPLMSAAFTCILEELAGSDGMLCSIIMLVLNRLSSASLYPSRAFVTLCVDCGLVFVSMALHLRPKMLVMLKKSLLNFLTLSGHHGHSLQMAKTRLIRMVGVVLFENAAPHFSEAAYQIVETLETVIHERARDWSSDKTVDDKALNLVCAAMTAMTRIVLVHTSLLTRVQLMLTKICNSDSHPLVLNRANESLKLVQMPELGYLLFQEDCPVARGLFFIN